MYELNATQVEEVGGGMIMVSIPWARIGKWAVRFARDYGIGKFIDAVAERMDAPLDYPAAHDFWQQHHGGKI